MIDVATEAVKEAGELANRFFKSQLKVNYKTDNSPVTKADRQVEQIVRKRIAKRFPEHGIIGEEFPPVNPHAKYQWIIDPVDGTRDFSRGVPIWSTILAVLESGKPILGVMFFPALNELFVAQKGGGAYLNSRQVQVSKQRQLKSAYASVAGLVKITPKVKNQIGRISHTALSLRALGSYGWSPLLQGRTEIYVAFKGKIYDFAAPAILVEEAGGKFTDLSGKFSLTSGNALGTNGHLHSQVLKLFSSK